MPSPYSILIDKREHKLHKACDNLIIPYETKQLWLGDIQVIEKESHRVCMMIERKTWQDLASSILDNRYKEQHARYVEWAKENNCEVWYILEGNKRFRTPSQEKRTLSAHISLCFDKWTRIVETKTPTETVEWIQRFLIKLHTKGKEWVSCGFLCENNNENTLIDTRAISNCDVELAQQKVQKSGKKEHSKQATWLSMMSCIYGMSVAKSKKILESWETPEEWVEWLHSVEPDSKDGIKRLSSIKITEKRCLGKVLASRLLTTFCSKHIVKKTD